MSQQTTLQSVETLGWNRTAFINRLRTGTQANDEPILDEDGLPRAVYKIRARGTNKLVDFGPAMMRRKAQYQALKDLLEAIRRGGPVSELWLKPRRSGRTTVGQCLAIDLCAFGGFNCGVMAHDEPTTNTIFRMGRTFWERLPPSKRPELRRESTTMLEFGTKRRKDRDADGGSPGELNTYDCRTAGGKHPFAGGTLHFLHGTEVAKWPGTEQKQEDTIADALNAMGADFPGIVIMETTANGPRGWYYHNYVEAIKYKDRPGFYAWTARFMAWFEDEGNRRAVPAHVVAMWREWPKDELEAEEELTRKYGCDMEQLWFRRQQIQKLGSAQKFKQDYPATWQEAFESTGKRVFEAKLIHNQLEHFVKPPKRRGHIITSL